MSASHDLHAAAVRYVAGALRRRGCAVTVHTGNDAVSLTANGLAVGVRAARTRNARKAVTVGGKRYAYRYPMLHFNLHAHGRRIHAPDVWALVAMDARPRPFVVPAGELTGLTVEIIDTPSARSGRGHGRIRGFAGRWDVITGRKRAGRPEGGKGAVGLDPEKLLGTQKSDHPPAGSESRPCNTAVTPERQDRSAGKAA